MDSIKRIEDRYRFKLPPIYKHLFRSGKPDAALEKLWIDLEFLSPDAIATYQWDDFRKPVDGLVPFAENGRSDLYCWYLPAPGRDGEPVVMLCTHDCYVGEWFALGMAATILRQTIEHLHIITDTADEWKENKQTIDHALLILNDFVPSAWRDSLDAVKHLTPKPDEQGDTRLMSDEEYEAIIRELFGERFVNQDFTWDKDGL